MGGKKHPVSSPGFKDVATKQTDKNPYTLDTSLKHTPIVFHATPMDPN
jgi:hypothetical protein